MSASSWVGASSRSSPLTLEEVESGARSAPGSLVLVARARSRNEQAEAALAGHPAAGGDVLPGLASTSNSITRPGRGELVPVTTVLASRPGWKMNTPAEAHERTRARPLGCPLMDDVLVRHIGNPP